MTDFSEALRLMALEVVGVTNPASVHDDERLRWGDIRKALQGVQFCLYRDCRLPGVKVDDYWKCSEGHIFWPAEETVVQRKCWQSGQNHLCNKKCADEPTHEEIDDFVREYRQEQQKRLDQDMENFRRLREGRWT